MQSMFASVRAALSQQPGPRISTAAPPAVDTSSRIAPCGSLRLPFRGVGVGAAPRLPLPPLVGLGANAVRTWGVDQLDEPFLRECAGSGVAVFAGLWINSSADGDGGVAAATAAVRRWGSLPVGEAIAAWVIGNEVELREAGGPAAAAAWRYIARVAAAVRASDPLARPLATAIADVAGGKAAAAATAAGVDFLLINAYGGAATLPERLAAQGFTGAYALGEYGPEGQWEAPSFQPTQPEPAPSVSSPRRLGLRLGLGAAPAEAGQASPASPRSQGPGGLRRALGRILPDAASGIAGGLGAAGAEPAASSIAGGLSSGLGTSSAGSGSGAPLSLPPGQGAPVAMEQSSGHKAASSLRAYAASLALAPVPPSGDDTAASGAIGSVPGGTAGAAAVWRALAVAGMRGSAGACTCIGSFLFYGGAKTEAGASGTWYSLLLTPAAARCAHWMTPRPVADRLAVHWLLWRATPPGAAAAAAGLSASSGYTPRHSLMDSGGSTGSSGSAAGPSLSLGDVLMQGAGSDPLAAVAAICSLARVPCALGVTVQLASAATAGSGATTFVSGSSLRAAVVVPPGAPGLLASSCACDWTLERLQGQGPAGAGTTVAAGGSLAASLALLGGGGGGGAGQPPLVATFQRVAGTAVDFPAPPAAATGGGLAIYRLTAFLRFVQGEGGSSADGSASVGSSTSYGGGGQLAHRDPHPHPVAGWFEARPDALAALVRDCAWLARDGVATASAMFAVV